jgi:hypothetical protein
MRELGCKSCKAVPDLWYKPAVDHDGLEYSAYILNYVDDVCCISHKAEAELLKIDRFFKFKNDSIGNPELYLGAKLKLVTLENGTKAWSTSASKYVQTAVQNVITHLKREGKSLPPKAKSPFPRNYDPLDDIS